MPMVKKKSPSKMLVTNNGKLKEKRSSKERCRTTLSIGRKIRWPVMKALSFLFLTISLVEPVLFF